MPDLSACYFCGTALDEPLSEYPVVPMTLQPAPDAQKTVVLCSACRRKLGRVLDAVLESVEDRPIDATVQQDLEEASGDGQAGGDDGDAAVDGGDTVEEEPDDVWVTAGDGESGDETVGVEADAGTSKTDAGASAADVDDPIESDGADEAGEIAKTEDPGNAETVARADEPLASGEPSAVDPPTAADGNGDEDDASHLSALEYTKVMRLLENRDLPVDREEFRVVATNAYEITDEEFDAVIDAAIDRGLVVEEDGAFVDVE